MSKIAVIGIVGNSVFLPVERFHVGGETVEASDIHFEPGGKGFNQAVAAARFGAEVAFLGAVGADFLESASSFLEKELFFYASVSSISNSFRTHAAISSTLFPKTKENSLKIKSWASRRK